MARKTNYGPVAKWANGKYASPADVIFGVSESAINNFLVAHFKNNPDFYDRSRERRPDHPLYRKELDDHGVKRVVKFWAKVEKGKESPAITIDLRDDKTRDKRFAAWWRANYGAKMDEGTQLPPNLLIQVSRVTLQINFPKVDEPTKEHEIDFIFTIKSACYVKLVEGDAGEKVLRLSDWEIVVEPIGEDPFLPVDKTNPVWGKSTAACEDELKKLRLLVRDAFTIGANVVLTNLAKTLTRTLPLPPIEVIKGLRVSPRELYITSSTIALASDLERGQLLMEAERRFAGEMQRFNEDLGDTDLNEIMQKVPNKGGRDAFDRYLRKALPAFASLDDRFQMLQGRGKARLPGPKTPLFPSADIFVMASGAVFDAIAKEFLHANAQGCSGWFGVDILLGYARGRGCYWFSLTDANGGLTGTTISLGCNVRAGGKLDLEACIRIPCADDECARWSPGLGLAGPLKVHVSVENSRWDNNRCLRLRASFGEFPGLEVYGLPPVVEDVVNKIVNFITSVAFRAFGNAVLSMLDFYIVEIPTRIEAAHVNLKVDELSVGADAGMLVLTGRTKFT
jgi:hypothetical protein